MDYQAYLFDMGNTLLDFHQGQSDLEKDMAGLERLVKFLEDECMISVDVTDLQRNFLDPWNEALANRTGDSSEPDVREFLMQGLADFGMDIPDWLCRRAMKEFFTEYKRQVQVMPGAQELLGSLKAKGKKVGIVANCTIYEDIFHDVFRSVGLAEFIDGYAFSYSHGVRKPNPRLFKRALDLLGASPQKAVMVGDRLDADICGAKKLGIATVWYNPRGLPGDGLTCADREVRSLRCLLE